MHGCTKLLPARKYQFAETQCTITDGEIGLGERNARGAQSKSATNSENASGRTRYNLTPGGNWAADQFWEAQIPMRNAGEEYLCRIFAI